MKVLVIGSGGREHAIAYKLKQSPKVTELYAIPGNPGIASLGTCVPGSVEDNKFIVDFIQKNQIDLTVIGPEVPLCNGLADDIEKAGYKAFGPQKKAATLEGSKAFSKDFMVRHHIPTAKYVEVTDFEKACKEVDHFDFPLVIKADGLAAGKGVVIVENKEDAISTLKDMMVDGALDGAGSKVVLEEFLTGFECSLLCFTDGKTIVPMVSAKDHKQIFDGNKGPNTGGMGTVSPNPFLPEGMDEVLKKDILDPFMQGLKDDQMDYRGVVFIGLMIENGKAKVLEFNVNSAPRKMGTFPQYAYPNMLARYAEVATFVGCTGTDEEKFEQLQQKINELKTAVGIPNTIREFGVDEQAFLDTLDEMVEAAFDDQCTGANPRYPLFSEIREMYLRAYYGDAEYDRMNAVEVKEEKVEDVKEGEHHPHLKEKIKAKAEKVKAGVR